MAQFEEDRIEECCVCGYNEATADAIEGGWTPYAYISHGENQEADLGPWCLECTKTWLTYNPLRAEWQFTLEPNAATKAQS